MNGVIKRLINSWSAVTPEDHRLIEAYLDDPGRFLFFQMAKIDQVHALAVARTLLIETEGDKTLDRNRLIRAALLHDSGKIKGDFTFWSRIFVGIIRRFQPLLRGKLAMTHPQNGWQRIRYGFYVDLVHPARGAHMARIFGIEPPVVELIRRHHDPPRQEQNPELTWLQSADNQN